MMADRLAFFLGAFSTKAVRGESSNELRKRSVRTTDSGTDYNDNKNNHLICDWAKSFWHWRRGLYNSDQLISEEKINTEQCYISKFGQRPSCPVLQFCVLCNKTFRLKMVLAERILK
jgi:hypothetical protein